MKRLLIALLSISTLQPVLGMDHNKRIRIEEIDELSPDQNFEFWLMELNTYSANLDVTGVRLQLAQHEEAKKVTPEERNGLFDKAAECCHATSIMRRFGSRLTENMTNNLLIQKFSLNEEADAAEKIKNLFYAFKLLKSFKFPQAHFGPQPYNTSDLRPSLNTILESLIMNEEEEISVCCFHLTMYTVAQALVKQKNKEKEVVVQVVTNQKQGEKNPVLQAIKHLVDNKIEVFAPKNQAFETNHHKFFIFKSNVCKKPLVWTGSYNCTGHSNENSWENVNIFDDEELVDDYCARFKEIKAASQKITPEELSRIESNPSKTALENNKVPEDLWPK